MKKTFIGLTLGLMVGVASLSATPEIYAASCVKEVLDKTYSGSNSKKTVLFIINEYSNQFTTSKKITAIIKDTFVKLATIKISFHSKGKAFSFNKVQKFNILEELMKKAKTEKLDALNILLLDMQKNI